MDLRSQDKGPRREIEAAPKPADGVSEPKSTTPVISSLEEKSRLGTTRKYANGLELTTYPAMATAVSGDIPPQDISNSPGTLGYPARPLQPAEAKERWDSLLGRPLRHIEAELVERDVSHRPSRAKGAAGLSIQDNWSGIEALPQAGKRWLSIAASWVVPAVSLPYPPEPLTNFIAAVWVGIDGDGSTDVFQAGVLCTITTTMGIPGVIYDYGVWWEWFPHFWVSVKNFPVSPGDQITVLLTANDTFQTLMFDVDTAFDEQPNDTGTWCMADWDKDGKADLIFVKTANTPSGRVEVHVATAKSDYQQLPFQQATVFELQPAGTGTWCMADFDKDGKADLIFVKTANTLSGKVELYIATAKSNYQTLVFDKPTAFDLQPANTGTWCMADFDKDGKADLIFIKTANTPSGKVEVHVATAKSNFQDLPFEKATVFDLQPPNTGTWCMADFDKDGKADLIFVKTADTPNGRVEVHIASAKSNYQDFIVQTSTAFNLPPPNGGVWCMADGDDDKIADLFFVKTAGTATGKVELFMASGNQGQSGNVVFRNETRDISTAIEFKAPKGVTLVGDSAEWIVERPTLNGSLVALPNYELVVFTDGTAADNTGSITNASQGTIQDDMTEGGLIVSVGQINDRDVVCLYTGRSSIFQHLLLQIPTAFDEQPDGSGVWALADYSKRGTADLIFIKTANTPTGKVELHIATGKSNYQDLAFQKATVFDLQPADTGTWCMADFDQDGKADLIFVKTANTLSGKVELYIATAKSNYQNLVFDKPTAFDLQPPNTGTWCMADWDKDGKADLIFIKTANTPSGKVEVHVATAKSNYQDLPFQKATVLDLQPPNAGTWSMVDFDRDGKADLIFIKTTDTTILDGKLEVHIASAKSDYQQFVLQLPTLFDLQPPGTGTWCIADCNNDKAIDLAFVKTATTDSGKVEIVIASGDFQP